MKMLLDTLVLFICVKAVFRNNKFVVFLNLITFIIQHLQQKHEISFLYRLLKGILTEQ